jgi:hypothetical protein
LSEWHYEKADNVPYIPPTIKGMSFIVFFVLATSMLLKGRQPSCVTWALFIGQLQTDKRN